MKSLPLLFLLFACSAAETTETASTDVPVAALGVSEVPEADPTPWLNPEGNSIATRFRPNPGFQRTEEQPASFAAFLRHQDLKPHGAKVYLHNGEEKYNQDVHAAVLNVSVGEADLQQCADAVMRLRAEYLLATERPEEIRFNFVNGFTADYERWRKGDRIRVNGNSTSWTTGAAPTSGRKAFDQYLQKVFMYANTASLEKELKPVPLKDIRIGDVLIHGGFPGHAVLVVDRAVNAQSGETEVLLAQSYMPAQDIHVLKNPIRGDANPWYNLKDMVGEVRTMEWTFDVDELRRF